MSPTNPPRVLVLAEPGLATQASREALRRLEAENYDISLSTRSLPLDDDGEIILSSTASETGDGNAPDIIIGVTELPRLAEDGPNAIDIESRADAALISLPGLGATGLPRKIANAITTVLQTGTEGRRTAFGARFPRWPRVLLGMVRVNRPWRLVPSLSSAMAAAAATAAFGIFFSSIWMMATALHPARLTLITAMSIAAMTLWLIAYNRLWDPPGARGKHTHAAVYNLATVLTVGLGVSMMYVGLYIATFIAALIVISWDFLGTTLGEPASLADYAKLAWLSTSMGTVAGALGSSAEDKDEIQRAAFANRERERRSARESSDS
ncbi:hypothetical protein HT102_13110 [Hoyosella sp. G463]|uniref:Uncharacterized protein n=1 Tax=Lolliginicoccus lacisalsi TaxID=2742202 RepID=A0A927JEY4_9ACTN|nr:hypothetical protein [Lolliginicoccus lacisalsi]MBD8507422.1 hypothetical protein [Lolliginicoccus lacisalsi]